MKIVIYREGSSIYFKTQEPNQDEPADVVGYTTPAMLVEFEMLFKGLGPRDRLLFTADVDDFLWGKVWKPGHRSIEASDYALVLDSTMTFTDGAVAGEDGKRGVQQPMALIAKALREDADYAWSWYCNLKMTVVDSGGTYRQACQSALRQLQLIFDLDISQHPYYEKDYNDSWQKDCETKTTLIADQAVSSTEIALLKQLVFWKITEDTPVPAYFSKEAATIFNHFVSLGWAIEIFADDSSNPTGVNTYKATDAGVDKLFSAQLTHPQFLQA